MLTPEPQLIGRTGKREELLQPLLVPACQRRETPQEAHSPVGVSSFSRSAVRTPLCVSNLHGVDIAGNDLVLSRQDYGGIARGGNAEYPSTAPKGLAFDLRIFIHLPEKQPVRARRSIETPGAPWGFDVHGFAWEIAAEIQTSTRKAAFLRIIPAGS